jgi:hypothetical protein
MRGKIKQNKGIGVATPTSVDGNRLPLSTVCNFVLCVLSGIARIVIDEKPADGHQSGRSSWAIPMGDENRVRLPEGCLSPRNGS